eukprot:6181207-Pleurochrysis_carterae.AAC.2
MHSIVNQNNVSNRHRHGRSCVAFRLIVASAIAAIAQPLTRAAGALFHILARAHVLAASLEREHTFQFPMRCACKCFLQQCMGMCSHGYAYIHVLDKQLKCNCTRHALMHLVCAYYCMRSSLRLECPPATTVLRSAHSSSARGACRRCRPARS